MPELPEVETIRRHLAPHVEGRTLHRLEVLDERWSRPLAPHELEAAVSGREIERLARRGKYLVWELEGDAHLICHLRMTGNFLLEPAAHTRAVFHLGETRDAGSAKLIPEASAKRLLHYDDPRRFGTGELALSTGERDAFFAARLGLEPFDPGFTPEHLRRLTRRSRAPIKAFLLDQTKVAGVGNIYADEALFRARIHPERPAERLTATQVHALHGAVQEALLAGIEAKGASIDDFRDPYGVQGSFQDRFLVHLREGEPCPRCAATIRKLRAAGRGTYVCERCQPRPRKARSGRPGGPPDRPGRAPGSRPAGARR